MVRWVPMGSVGERWGGWRNVERGNWVGIKKSWKFGLKIGI